MKCQPSWLLPETPEPSQAGLEQTKRGLESTHARDFWLPAPASAPIASVLFRENQRHVPM